MKTSGDEIVMSSGAESEARLGSKLILVIEDDEAIREFIVAALGDEGYAVHEAANGRIGLERARELCPDVILVDLIMPEMDGRELIAHYRSDPAARCRFILMSAASASEHAELETRVEHILAKPFDIDELLDVVERLVSQA